MKLFGKKKEKEKEYPPITAFWDDVVFAMCRVPSTTRTVSRLLCTVTRKNSTTQIELHDPFCVNVYDYLSVVDHE